MNLRITKVKKDQINWDYSIFDSVSKKKNGKSIFCGGFGVDALPKIDRLCPKKTFLENFERKFELSTIVQNHKLLFNSYWHFKKGLVQEYSSKRNSSSQAMFNNNNQSNSSIIEEQEEEKSIANINSIKDDIFRWTQKHKQKFLGNSDFTRSKLNNGPCSTNNPVGWSKFRSLKKHHSQEDIFLKPPPNEERDIKKLWESELQELHHFYITKEEQKRIKAKNRIIRLFNNEKNNQSVNKISYVKVLPSIFAINTMLRKSKTRFNSGEITCRSKSKE